MTVPRFEDFPVSVSKSQPAGSVDFHLHHGASQYRTAIEKALREGVSFAGEFAMAVWGCGTGCRGIGIVRVTDGAVLMFVEGFTKDGAVALFNIESGSPLGIDYRADSKLLILNPTGNTDDYKDNDMEWLCDRLRSAWQENALPRFFVWQDEYFIEVTPEHFRYENLNCSSK